MLNEKAQNYYVLGRIAETLAMYAEAATNYFKALFAVDDFSIAALNKPSPKDHTT